MRMWGYQQAHRIHEPKYRIRGCEDMRLQASTQQPIWGCRDASEGTWTWGYEDVGIEASKYTQP